MRVAQHIPQILCWRKRVRNFSFYLIFMRLRPGFLAVHVQFTLRNLLSPTPEKHLQKIRKSYNGPIWFEMKSNQMDIWFDSLGNNGNKCAFVRILLCKSRKMSVLETVL